MEYHKNAEITSIFTKESLDDIPLFQYQGFSTILDDILIDADIVFM